ncbi:MAG: hypothetical protein HQ510_05435 [Candidatus Marinimicrobia bacterium]|nr:hypothetical protein [Candidatus Neomarinimicrobiota bacterium]
MWIFQLIIAWVFLYWVFRLMIGIDGKRDNEDRETVGEHSESSDSDEGSSYFADTDVLRPDNEEEFDPSDYI